MTEADSRLLISDASELYRGLVRTTEGKRCTASVTVYKLTAPDQPNGNECSLDGETKYNKKTRGGDQLSNSAPSITSLPPLHAIPLNVI